MRRLSFLSFLLWVLAAFVLAPAASMAGSQAAAAVRTEAAHCEHMAKADTVPDKGHSQPSGHDKAVACALHCLVANGLDQRLPALAFAGWGSSVAMPVTLMQPLYGQTVGPPLDPPRPTLV